MLLFLCALRWVKGLLYFLFVWASYPLILPRKNIGSIALKKIYYEEVVK